MNSPNDAEMLKDLLACACPGLDDDSGGTPRCAVERFIGEGAQLLFVTPCSRQLTCAKLLHFGNGHICTCPHRVTYYKKHNA